MSHEKKTHRRKDSASDAVGILLSNAEHWPTDDEVIRPEELAANTAYSGLNPEEALIAKEEAEKEAGLRRFSF